MLFVGVMLGVLRELHLFWLPHGLLFLEDFTVPLEQHYCEQIEAFQAGSTAVNTPAWNNAIGLAPTALVTLA